MSYQESIKQSLALYKANKYPTLTDGAWEKNKKAYPHILPKEDKKINLLPTYRKDLMAFIDDSNIKLHTDFHHLNSSQAMCLNFFYPLIKEKKLELVLDFLGFDGEVVDYNTAYFEKDGLELSYKETPTSFDFYLETESGKKFHFEIKYTENDFGKASKDKRHLEKFNNVYSKHLTSINSDFHSVDVFLDNYQVLRNLIHIEDNSYVIFLYPMGNKKIRIEAESARQYKLENKFKNNFFPVTWEDLYEFICNAPMKAELQEQFSEFKNKYL